MTDQKKPKLKGKLKGNVSILRLIRSHWRGLSLALAAVLGETITDVLQPWPIKVIVDSIVQSKKLPGWLSGPVTHLFGADKHAILNFAVASVAAIAVLGAISSYIEKYMTTSISQWIAHDLRRTLYDHIQRLSLAEHDQTRTGDLISRVTDDIEAVRDFINSAMLGMLVDGLTLAGMIAVMFYVSWHFTLIALSIVPPLFAVVYVLTRQIKKASRDVRKKKANLTSIVEEGLNSARVVKAFAREDYEVKRFESESLETVQTALRARGLKAKLSPIVEVTVAAGTCLVLWYGAREALSGQISAGVLIVFLLYLDKMYKPMRDLSKETDTVSKAMVGYDRIQEVLGIESRVRDLPGAKRAPRFKGAIEFEHVGFNYEGGAPVFNDISFQVEPGQVAALVGPSGTGKTTVVSLIPRFYDPSPAGFKIDGQDVRRYKLQSLREQISFILQDTLLFHATVAENIAYGKPGAREKEIVKAAQLANAAEFIEQMPQGYARWWASGGFLLSGGQRQRIAIARAIIRNAPILLLDEPTSSLDAEAEQSVMEALYRLMAGRTCIVIAHHLSTIRRANAIFVIKDSEIVERGTHKELLAAGGSYAELFKLQSEAMSLK